KPWQVFSREVLLEQVWGYRHQADTRLVNVHVQRLRAKVERDPERPEVVLTVRGVGYRAGAQSQQTAGIVILSSARARFRGRLRGLLLLWRSSLRLLVVSMTFAAGMIALFALGAVLSGQVRDGLFDERLEQVLADAALRADSAQRRFDAATANSTQEDQQLANDTVRASQETASGTDAAVLLRAEPSTGPIHIVPTATDITLRDVISPELRAQVEEQQFQQWQSVEVPVGE